MKVAVGVIEESRQLRLQPFNEYRKRFGMKPYKSFQELTGRAAVLPQELSGLRWGSADALRPRAGYETTSCPPLPLGLPGRAAAPAHPSLAWS